MKWLQRPEVWFPLALLILAGVGLGLLSSEHCVHLSERDHTAYGQRPAWQAGFDAVSATCGVGLLTYRLDQDYTLAGRWGLAALGLAGAMLFLVAARQMAGRLWPAAHKRLPATRLILAAFVVGLLLAVVAVVLVERVGGAQTSVEGSAWNAVSLFSSLGWLRSPAGFAHSWIYAVVAFAGALGWPLWLGGAVWRGAGWSGRGWVVAACSYIAFLAVSAGLVTALEVARGVPHGKPAPTNQLAIQTTLTRYGRALTLVTCTAGAGAATERLDDRSVGEGTKLVLAGLVLVGGLGGNPGGGLTWALLIGGLAALFARGRKRAETQAGRPGCGLFGAAYAQLLLGLTLVVVIGLLLIESRTGAAYQAPPTLGDALLDGASAVGGAGLASGLTADITDLRLSSGIRQKVDLYQYGMTWLMLAMFLGRVLPVLVAAVFAHRQARDDPGAA
jgi:Trk-type K+ transport system membrane component